VGVRVDVGGEHLGTDLARCEALRAAVGDSITVATDANGKWDLPTAQRFARETEPLALFWIEEPLWYDDVESHHELAATSSLPIALGEQIYNPESLTQFIRRGALHFVQPDVTRIGGVTGFLDAAACAQGAGLPVAAHAGDMSQVHLHMACALPHHTMLEYIPWIAHCFQEPATVLDGRFIRPEAPGASTTPTTEAWETYRVT
jgi:L-alanine-DL-glutamate epimerase-like enolase superfamily enzyme